MSDEPTPDEGNDGTPADGDESDGDDVRGVDADPFERLDEGAGPHHGDPFESLGGDGDATAAADDGLGEGDDDWNSDDAVADDATADDVTDDDMADEDVTAADVGGGDVTDGDRPAELPEGADPFDGFDAPESDPFAEGRTIFDRDPEDLDDGVWERMDRADADAAAVPGKRHVDVNKHAYCEGCEYFSAPPDVACSHEGTEILEFVDVDTVRVVDCPVVAERTALQDVE